GAARRLGEGEDRNERAVGEHTAGVVAEEGAARRVREPRVRHRPRLEPLRRAPGGTAVVGARVRHADAARVVVGAAVRGRTEEEEESQLPGRGRVGADAGDEAVEAEPADRAWL